MPMVPANQSCPCLKSLAPFGVPDRVTMRIESTDYDYGPTYGLYKCFTHDANRLPHCISKESHCVLDGQTSVTDLASRLWCFDPWCYVNRSECDLPSAATGSGGYSIIGLEDPSLELHYSYATCGLHCDQHAGFEELNTFNDIVISSLVWIAIGVPLVVASS